MNNFVKQLLFLFMASNLLINPLIATAKDLKLKPSPLSYNLNELVLPSEIKSIAKSSGSIYYSPTVKGKVLMPIHYWGEVGKSGLHFLPLDTSFINGLSLAGGPSSNAVLEKVKLMRKSPDGKFKNYSFDLSGGGSGLAHNFKLKPEDAIFIEKSTFREDRAYYTSLIGVIATILSSVILYDQVRNIN